MLRWSIAFLLVALLAAVFGFSDVASEAAGVGKVLCFLFLACFVISFVTGLFRMRRRRKIVVRVQQPMR